MRIPHRPRVLLTIAASVAVLAGCGGDPAPDAATTPSPQPGRVSPVPTNGSYNAADVVFTQDTLAQLRQAAEMAKLAKQRGSAEVKALAAKAEQDRQPGLILLPRWLEENRQPPPQPGQAVAGLATAEQMAALAAAEGAEFDRLYLELMIKMDEAAANLLTGQQWSGLSGPLISLTHKLSDDQQAELAAMRALLGR